MMRMLFALMALMALSLGAVACGDDEDTDTSTTDTAAMEADNEAMEDEAMEEATSDIVDTAVANGSFETLVAAVTAAELVETLKGEGPFTVFAPTDAAFQPLVDDGTVDTLLLPENKQQLTDILTYHVVPGEAMAADLSDGQKIATVNGAELTVSIADDGTVMIDDATVVTADIDTSNGVIHVIDAVMLPPEA